MTRGVGCEVISSSSGDWFACMTKDEGIPLNMMPSQKGNQEERFDDEGGVAYTLFAALFIYRHVTSGLFVQEL